MKTSEFALAVSQGLNSREKYLSSRYFYDDKGDRLFRKIMATPEYYLTNSEHEILSLQVESIVDQLAPGADIIELGAGDGSKTRVLLAEHFKRQRFCYRPVDISDHSLSYLQACMKKWLPELEVAPMAGEYMEALDRLPEYPGRRVFMFMGSNIGNFTPTEAVKFLAHIGEYMKGDDRLLIGFDLKKNPQTILAAYDDAAGYTRAFNLNLLARINRELGGDFDLEQFKHRPCYDPQTGACKSFLVSQRQQNVYLKHTGERFEFVTGERIFMEISQKYSPAELQELAHQSGFSVQASFMDSRRYFIDEIWRPLS